MAKKTKTKKTVFYPFESGFLRSVSLPLICTFAGIAIAVVVLVYFSFYRGLRSRINSAKMEELSTIESSITGRLDEFDLIVSDIYRSPNFLFAELPADRYQGYNMSKEIERYLVGNTFLSYLIYYRSANPDKFFSSEGELSAKNFYDAYLNYKEADFDTFMEEIRSTGVHKVIPLRKAVDNKDYLTLIEPVPAYSTSRLAFAIGIVEKKALKAYMEPLFVDCDGEILMLDSDMNLLYSYSSGMGLDDDAVAAAIEAAKSTNSVNKRLGGRSCTVQTTSSRYDKWQFIAIYDNNSLYSDLYWMESLILVIFLIVVAVAIFTSLSVIMRNFRPINQLARAVMDDVDQDGKRIIDEHRLLTSHFINLYEEQRKMYSTIFFSNLLANQYDRSLLEDALDEYNIEFHGNIYCPLVIMEESNRDERRLSEIVDVVWECLNTENITSYVHVKNSPYSMVVCMNGSMEEFSYENIADLLRNLYEQVKNKFDIRINIGIGDIMSNLLDFPENVAKATSAAFICMQNPDVYFTEYNSGVGETIPAEASDFISRLSVYIKQNNVDEVRNCFAVAEDSSTNYVKPILRNYMAYSIALTLLEYAKEAGDEEKLDVVFKELSSEKSDIGRIFNEIKDIAIEITVARQEKNRRDREEKSQAHELLNKIKKVIDERLCDSMLSLDALADECGVSPSYLSRYFKQRMDCTPMAYVENARMEIAKKLLVTTELSLDEILERSGYIDKSNFIRKFKKREGITPMSYRKAYIDN